MRTWVTIYNCRYYPKGPLMKARQAIVVAVASAIVAATGVIGVGTASAATPREFCVNNSLICAFPEGGNAVAMLQTNKLDPLWLYNGVNHPGQIQQAATGLCMQLDHNAGNIIIEAACNKASYQEWNPYLLAGSVVYASVWDGSQCLTYNQDLSRLDTVDCTGAWYQNFPGAP